MVSSNRAHLNTEFAGASVPQGDGGGNPKLIIGLAVIVGLGAIVGGVAAAGDGPGWKSRSVAEGAAVGAAIAIPVTLVAVLLHGR